GDLRFNWEARDELQVALIDDPEPLSGFRRISLGPTHPDAWWPIVGMGSGYLETSDNQIRDFVDAIVGGGAGRPNFADGVHVQRVVGAVIESARSEVWVDMKNRSYATA
ncbi:MAG: gfo/Idh/MocA family oxidoreductase, partial [Chloroflexota bacterium]|nr:gfo/Idh/MocA family oxidoreductase [Chloroflexota bacterium]